MKSQNKHFQKRDFLFFSLYRAVIKISNSPIATFEKIFVSLVSLTCVTTSLAQPPEHRHLYITFFLAMDQLQKECLSPNTGTVKIHRNKLYNKSCTHFFWQYPGMYLNLVLISDQGKNSKLWFSLHFQSSFSGISSTCGELSLCGTHLNP